MTALSRPPRVVVLGMMSRIPVPGVIWQTMHYLLGLERLGCEVWYVEDHGMTPTVFFDDPRGDGWNRAASFVDNVMRQFGLGGRWAYHAEHGGGRHFGLSSSELGALYRSAALLLNLHGATRPRAEHAERGRLVLVETDPVELETQLAEGDAVAIDYAAAHSAFFTFGENVGRPECLLPATPGFDFRPTRQPVILELWEGLDIATRPVFTTIGNWRQLHRSVSLGEEIFHWSKHLEFLRFLDLPARTGQAFELALASCEAPDRATLAGNGWGTRSPFLNADSMEDYRRFIGCSYGEFTVAKDQNIRLKTGWFSDRSATYLAAGRPVVTQDTGFGCALPTGKGLFAFETADDAANAIAEIRSNYALHQRAARDIAREWFSAEVVLGEMLGHLGISTRAPSASHPFHGLPDGLDLEPVSRRPLTLLDTTTAVIEARVRARTLQAEARPPARTRSGAPFVTIVIVVHNQAHFTATCLESLLADSGDPSFEVVVVNNGSGDRTSPILDAYQRLDPRVRVISNETNRGFAAANNQGIAAAEGEVIVLLNNDTIVTPGWLTPLVSRLETPGIGLVGPTTNRTCNEAQIDADYRTIGQLRAFAECRLRTHGGQNTDMTMLAMFCVAGRRETFDEIGPLDERFELGMFEDDDYAMRARAAGYRLVCAEDAYVHHFGQASIGTLTTNAYEQLFESNRARFESKWGRAWQPHGRRVTAAYTDLCARVRRAVEAHVAPGTAVLVAAKGDDAMLRFEGRVGKHFPGRPDGSFLGEYPPDSASAIEMLERSRKTGAQYMAFPEPSAWWLEHYSGLRAHLDAAYGPPAVETADLVMWSLDERSRADVRADPELSVLRHIVAEQGDMLGRVRAELATLRATLIDRDPTCECAGDFGTPDSQEEDDRTLAGSLRETWRVLDRALEEGEASKHTRYLLLRARLRAEVVDLTAPGSTIAVVSRGDDELITLPGRTAWHVPRLADGSWSAGLPADGADAVRCVEILRAFGADYLVLPATYAWWLECYRELAEHLGTRSVELQADPEVGFVWDLRTDTAIDGTMSLEAAVAATRRRLVGEDPTMLDAGGGCDLRSRFPELAVFSPPESDGCLPYLDDTVDIVAVGPDSTVALDEAIRVASIAVVHLPAAGHIPRCRVTWKSARPEAGPTVSIIAPQPTQARTADALIRSLPPRFRGEIVVPGYDVDDRRSDEAPLRRVPPEASPARWARAAALAATADVVVFVDPALVPLRGRADALVPMLGTTSPLGAITGVLLTPSSDGLGGDPAAPTSGLFAVRRELLAAVGGLPAASGFEDACAELAESLRHAGHVVTSEPTAVAVRADLLEIA